MNNMEKYILFAEIENTIKRANKLTLKIENDEIEERKERDEYKEMVSNYVGSSSSLILECPVCYEKKKGKVIPACGHEICLDCECELLCLGEKKCVLCRERVCK
jgi:hypothetical protein